MKTYHLYLLAVLIVFPVLDAHAQPEYLYTANLEAYEGSWTYTSNDGTEVFILKLQKAWQDTNLFTGECLVGGYYHSKNGQVLADTRNNLPNQIIDANYFVPYCPSFFGDNGCARPDCVTPDEVNFFFWDERYGEKRLPGYLTLLTMGTLQFEVWEGSHISTIQPPKSNAISVPQDVVLTKVASLPPLPSNPDLKPEGGGGSSGLLPRP